jgi:hypothetical protein
MLKNFERRTVKTIKPVLRCDPIESFLILQYGFHFIGGKPVFGGEVFEDLVGRLGKRQVNTYDAKGKY